MQRKKPVPEFWVSNISGRKDVSLGDLRVKIPLGKTVNLLDPKRYHFTEKQLLKSKESGSIALKSQANLIRVRQGEPQKPPTMVQDIERSRRVLQPLRTKVDVTAEYHEELDFEDSIEAENAMAEEMAELDFQQRAPALAVDQKYRNAAKHRVEAGDKHAHPGKKKRKE